MPEIVLTEEQAKVLAAADAPVTVRRPDGLPVGALDPADAALLATAVERARRHRENPMPGVPAGRLHAGLVALQAEWDRLGEFSEDYARDFLARHTASHE